MTIGTIRAPQALVLLLALVAACDPAPAEDPGADLSRAQPAMRPPPRPDRLIRADGVGLARIGMTIGQLRASLPPNLRLGERSSFMVDIDGMPVVEGGDTLYRVLILAGEPAADDAIIELLATSHPGFRTGENVGPGSTLAEAAAKYGQPTLSYSINDESREYAAFDALPPGIMLRVTSAADSLPFAGVYGSEGEYNETTRYHSDARISMVLVGRR